MLSQHKRHNATYKKHLTKRQQSFITKLKLSLFPLAIALIALNYILLPIINPKTSAPVLRETPDQIIILRSNHPENEKTAWLASISACNKHLPTAQQYTRDDCTRLLMAIAHQENRDFSFTSTGADSYTSYGLFQISLYYHSNITITQALDPYFSADWTLARLINHGLYSGNRNNAIMSHNGTPNIPATIKYLNGVNNYYNVLAINY